MGGEWVWTKTSKDQDDHHQEGGNSRLTKIKPFKISTWSPLVGMGMDLKSLKQNCKEDEDDHHKREGKRGF